MVSYTLTANVLTAQTRLLLFVLIRQCYQLSRSEKLQNCNWYCHTRESRHFCILSQEQAWQWSRTHHSNWYCRRPPNIQILCSICICHHREGVYTHQQHPLHLVSCLLRPIWDIFCLLRFGFWDLWCKMQLKSYTRCGIFGVIPRNNMNAILQPFTAAVPLDIFSALPVNKAGQTLWTHSKHISA